MVASFKGGDVNDESLAKPMLPRLPRRSPWAAAEAVGGVGAVTPKSKPRSALLVAGGAAEVLVPANRASRSSPIAA